MSTRRKKAEVDQDPYDPDEAVTATLLSAIYKLRDNLRRFKPIDVAGTPHKEMAQYIDALAAKTDQRLKGIESILHDRKWSNVYSDAA
ncbi:MAG: hypothetical protein U1D35_00980 [Paracoccaceae bacterium]|nr:hypothetical protein [Paracoccaceae bacterium]